MGLDIEKVYLDFKQLIVSAVKAQFAESHSAPPILLVGTESKSIEDKIEMTMIPAHEFLSDESGKMALSHLMTQIAKENKPIFIGLVVEAYMVKLNIGENMGGLPPSEHPNRVEAVLVTFESKSFKRQLMFEIVRPTEGDPYLKEPEEQAPSHVEGRFADVFKDSSKGSDENPFDGLKNF